MPHVTYTHVLCHVVLGHRLNSLRLTEINWHQGRCLLGFYIPVINTVQLILFCSVDTEMMSTNALCVCACEMGSR